jgi:cytochrome P450
MIDDRSKSYRDCSDLLSNLIAANENDSEGLRLTEEELVGNIFIFLIGKPLNQLLYTSI